MFRQNAERRDDFRGGRRGEEGFLRRVWEKLRGEREQHHRFSVGYWDSQYSEDDNYESSTVPEGYQPPRLASVVSSSSFGSNENWRPIGPASLVPSLRPLPRIPSGGLVLDPAEYEYVELPGGLWFFLARDASREDWHTASSAYTSSLGLGKTTPRRRASSAPELRRWINNTFTSRQMDAPRARSGGDPSEDADILNQHPTFAFRPLRPSKHGVPTTSVFRYVFQNERLHPEARRFVDRTHIGPPPSVLPPDPPSEGRQPVFVTSQTPDRNMGSRTPDRKVSPTASSVSSVNTSILFTGVTPPPQMSSLTGRPSALSHRTPSGEQTFSPRMLTSRVDNIIQANGVGTPSDLRKPKPFRTAPINDFYAVTPGPGVEISPGGNSVKVNIERDPNHPRNISHITAGSAERCAAFTRPHAYRDNLNVYAKPSPAQLRPVRGGGKPNYRVKEPKKRPEPDMAELRRKYLLRKAEEARLASLLTESSGPDTSDEEEGTNLKSPLTESLKPDGVQEEEDTEPKSPITELIDSYLSSSEVETDEANLKRLPKGKEKAELDSTLGLTEALPGEGTEKSDLKASAVNDILELYMDMEDEETDLEAQDALIEAMFLNGPMDIGLRSSSAVLTSAPTFKGKEKDTTTQPMSIEPASMEGNEEYDTQEDMPATLSIVGNRDTSEEYTPAASNEASSVGLQEKAKLEASSVVGVLASPVVGMERSDLKSYQTAPVEMRSPKGKGRGKNPDLEHTVASMIRDTVQESDEIDLQVPSVNAVEQLPFPAKEAMFKSTLAELSRIPRLKGMENAKLIRSFSAAKPSSSIGKELAKPNRSFSAGKPASSTEEEDKVKSQGAETITPVIQKTETPLSFKSQSSRVSESSLGRAYNSAPGAAILTKEQLAMKISSLKPTPKPQAKPVDQLQKGNAIMAEWQRKKKRVSDTSDASSSKKQ